MISARRSDLDRAGPQNCKLLLQAILDHRQLLLVVGLQRSCLPSIAMQISQKSTPCRRIKPYGTHFDGG